MRDTEYDKDRKDSKKKTKINNKNKLKNSVNNSSGTISMHNPSSVTAIPLMREHYMVIDNLRDKNSDTNPNGS